MWKENILICFPSSPETTWLVWKTRAGKNYSKDKSLTERAHKLFRPKLPNKLFGLFFFFFDKQSSLCVYFTFIQDMFFGQFFIFQLRLISFIKSDFFWRVSFPQNPTHLLHFNSIKWICIALMLSGLSALNCRIRQQGRPFRTPPPLKKVQNYFLYQISSLG